MSFGQVYCDTWFGENSNKQTINFDFANCGNQFNRKAVRFDGVSPAESISVNKTPFEFTENEGMLILGWIKVDASLNTASFSNFGQRCIVDLSSNLFNTATAKGYSIYVRKTTTTFTINWYYNRTGLTRTQCNIDIDLNQFDLSKPMLIAASLYEDNVNGVPSTQQDFRIWQTGVNANNYVDGTTKTVAITGMTYPTSQSLCFGNTNNAGSTSAEFKGIIDEIVIYNGKSGSTQIAEDYRQLSDNYFQGNGGSPQLDISQLAFYNQVVGWYRFGDNINGTQFPNASGGAGVNAIGDNDFSLSQVVGNII